MAHDIRKIELLRICSKFRNAIIELKYEKGFHRKSLLKNFPRGCCGVTTSLLRYYLKKLEIDTQEYCGYYKNVPHAFLKYQNLIIDLTADQFLDEDRPAVYVDEADDFYKSMTCIKTYQFYDFFQCYNEDPLDSLGPHAVNVYDYRAIVSKLK